MVCFGEQSVELATTSRECADWVGGNCDSARCLCRNNRISTPPLLRFEKTPFPNSKNQRVRRKTQVLGSLQIQTNSPIRDNHHSPNRLRKIQTVLPDAPRPRSLWFDPQTAVTFHANRYTREIRGGEGARLRHRSPPMEPPRNTPRVG